uniref:Delta-like 1 isoform AS5 n=1 Tax=Capra hircus TaxID=9925 RepID=A0A1C9BBN1_CAPHI|nr:delta-like 1 isoform AS5 [Capra hircus]
MTATAALLPVLLLLLAFGRSAHGAECFPACHPENGFCYNHVLRKKKNLLLRYNSGEELAVNIVFPEKIDMTTFTKEAGEEEI